jgi:hypothetical protein
MTPEGFIVKQIREWLKGEGYITFNLITVSPSGYPDMIVINPVNGEHTYLEVKTENGRLSPTQVYRIEKLRLANVKVYVVNSLNRVKEIFKND